MARYRYDGLGRRIEKAVDGGLSHFVYDGEDLVAAYDSVGCLQQGVLHGPGIDAPFALVADSNHDCSLTGESPRYLHADGLGSITSLVAELGPARTLTLVERSTYDSFGTLTLTGPGPDGLMDTADDVTLPQSAYGNPYAFTGREFDPESGLYYSRRRYYDPRIGRFLQEDPTFSINSYVYVLNNPVRYVDPYGLSAKDVENIEKQARKDIDTMTANGQRMDPGLVNNLVASGQYLNPSRKKSPLLGCGQQADVVAADLQSRPYDDTWTFAVEQRGPLHQRGRATSSNPGDSDVIFDPWKNSVYTVPKGDK